jgi:IS30 family transposase
MAYKRVTEMERTLVYRWKQAGFGIRDTARLLQRSASSISREIKRNKGSRKYWPQQAQGKAEARALRPGARSFTEGIRIEVEARIKEGWTPDMIGQRAKVEKRPGVSKETIYNHIYAEAKKGGTLWMHLPRAGRKRKRRCPRLDGRGRGRIPNQRRIDTRPAEVETRQRVGHWEGDLINGARETGNLVTLVERNTRFTLIGWTSSKEADEVTEVVCALLGKLPPKARSGVTFDNGKEFANHEEISRRVDMDVYFAWPYHSWERGTNENRNGMIRRLHPKKSSFAGIGDKELERMDRFVNDRPLKCLGWMTPREKMTLFIVSAP